MRRREFYWSLYHSTEKNQLDNLKTDQVEAVFAAIPAAQRKEWWIWRDGFEQWKPFADFPQLLVSLRKADDHQVEEPPPLPGEANDKTAIRAQGTAMANVAKTKVLAKSENTKSGLTKSGNTKSGLTKSGSVKLEHNPAGKRFIQGPRAAKAEMEFDEVTPFSGALTLMKDGIAEDRSNFRFDREIEVRIVTTNRTYTNMTVNISLKGMQFRKPLPKDLPHYFNVEITDGKKVIPVVCTEVKNSDGSPSNRVKIEVNDYAAGLLAFLLAAG